jgi:hypothetical protein
MSRTECAAFSRACSGLPPKRRGIFHHREIEAQERQWGDLDFLNGKAGVPFGLLINN